MDQAYEVHKLPDGSSLMTIAMEDCQTFDVRMYVKYGSLHVNSRGDYEVAHFLEHLVATLPSVRYPSSRRNKRLLQKKGIKYNATTVRRWSIYHYMGMKHHMDYVLSLLLACYLDFKVDDREFDQEKRAVLNELKGKMSDPSHVLYEKVSEILYSKSPLIAGHTLRLRYQNASRLELHDVLSSWKSYYRGTNILFVVSGGFETSKVVSFFMRHITKRPVVSPRMPPSGRFLWNKGPLTSSVIVPAGKNTKVWVLWTMPFTYSDHIKCVYLDLVGDLMLGLSGRLMRLLRTKLGYVYSILRYETNDEDNRLCFGFSTQVDDSEKVDETVKLITGELEEMSKIRQGEVVALKNKAEYRHERETQEGRGSPTFWAYEYALDELMGFPPLGPTERMKIIRSVTSSDLYEVVKKSFVSKNRVVLIGLPDTTTGGKKALVGGRQRR